MRKLTPLALAVLFAVWVLVFAANTAMAQQQSPEEQAAWKLEQAYWEYVKSVDLEQYRNLWHPGFVGWPSSSPEPVRK
ncbi:MAG: hypothetical protein WBN92_19820, partial [Terriglobia bacterium]